MRKPEALLVWLAVALAASTAPAGTLGGTVMVGGVILDGTGDRTAVQETSNIYEGFSLSQLRLNGTLAADDRYTIDLREVNLGSRSGDLTYRRPGLFTLAAGFDQYRQRVSPAGDGAARRKAWTLGTQYTPTNWLSLSGDLNRTSHAGARLAYPAGTASVLGTQRDNSLTVGQVSAQARRGRSGAALTYRASGFSVASGADPLDGASDRTGQVVSARIWAPSMLYDKWTHLVRGSYGVRQLSNDDIEYRLADFAYTSVITPASALELRYSFGASRVDDQATALVTDRLQNTIDATLLYRFGQVSGGYGYETNDDDATLTSYQSWRASTVFRYHEYVTARVNYVGRNKEDQEDLTLLKDTESTRLRAQLQVRPLEAVTVGGGYSRRARELPDIGVKVKGNVASGFARYTNLGWGAVSADYKYSKDTYDNLLAGFGTRSNVVTGRVDFSRIRNLQIGGGVTYLDIDRDLDIEKSLLFAEGALALPNNCRIEVKYNVYNYDDYVLLDRYYTANVLWINIGYEFSLTEPRGEAMGTPSPRRIGQW